MNPNTSFDIVFEYGGKLSQDFSEVGRILIINEDEPQDLISRVKRKINALLFDQNLNKRQSKKLIAFLKKDYNLIFCNTIVCGNTLSRIPKISSPVVSYVHEMERTIRYFDSGPIVQWQLQHSDYFIVPSMAVWLNLEKNHNIPKEKVRFLPYFIPDVSHKKVPKVPESGKPKFKVGSCGTLDFRKGADLFISTIVQFRKHYPEFDVSWIWIGGDVSAPAYDLIKADICTAGLEEVVTLIPPSEKAAELIGGLDVFLLTSREDPYPLVMLEAAMHKIPTICFEHSGGAPEFVDSKGGIIVPYLDTSTFAASLYQILNDDVLRKEMGTSANEKFKKLHSSENTLQKFAAILERTEKIR